MPINIAKAAMMGAAGADSSALETSTISVISSGASEMSIAYASGKILASTGNNVNLIDDTLLTDLDGANPSGVVSLAKGAPVIGLSNGNFCVAYATTTAGDLYIAELSSTDLTVVNEVQLHSSDANATWRDVGLFGALVEGASGDIYFGGTLNGINGSVANQPILIKINSSFVFQKAALLENGTPTATSRFGHEVLFSGGKLYARVTNVTARHWALCEINQTTLAVTTAGTIYSAANVGMRPATDGTYWYSGDQNTKTVRRFSLSTLAEVSPSISLATQVFGTSDGANGHIITDGTYVYLYGYMDEDVIDNLTAFRQATMVRLNVGLTTRDSFLIETESVAAARPGTPYNMFFGANGNIYVAGNPYTDVFLIKLRKTLNTVKESATIDGEIMNTKLFTGKTVTAGTALATGSGTIATTDTSSDYSSAIIDVTWGTTGNTLVTPVDFA